MPTSERSGDEAGDERTDHEGDPLGATTPNLVNVVAINAAFALMAAEVGEEARPGLPPRERKRIRSGKAYERLMELAS